MLEVRLAGELGAAHRRRELAPPTSKRARAVLAYLALNPGPQPRGRLAARFWPDVLDESARASLRVALTELRQALGPAAGHVVATRDTVALDGPGPQRRRPRPSSRRSTTAIRCARSRHAAPRSSTASTKSGRSRHGMSTPHRLGEALEQAAARRRPGRGRPADPGPGGARPARRGAQPPADREARRQPATAPPRCPPAASSPSVCGRSWASRRRARRGRCSTISAAASRHPSRRHPASTRAYETEFVGRRAELERLRASWAGVQMHRDRRIVLVAGEPGIGKTRLAHHFGAAALAPDATVLLGRCSEEPLAPFEPFAEALRPGRPRRRPPARRHRRHRRATSPLRRRRLRAHRPRRRELRCCCVIDDFHWADRGTLLLTSFLLRSSRPGPMLVLGTYRDTELGRRHPAHRRARRTAARRRAGPRRPARG